MLRERSQHRFRWRKKCRTAWFAVHRKVPLLFLGILGQIISYAQTDKTLWQIGQKDNSAAEFALYPDKYNEFVTQGFGHENRYYTAGRNTAKEFPYVLMGPAETHIWAGYVLHRLPIFFQLEHVQPDAKYELTIRLLNVSRNDGMFLRTEVNGHFHDSKLPNGKKGKPVAQNLSENKPVDLSISITGSELKEGTNTVTLQLFRGNWVMFDGISFTGPDKTKLVDRGDVPFISAHTAPFEMEKAGKRVQPLLVETMYMGRPVEIEIDIDGKKEKKRVEEGKAVYEIPMDRVNAARTSRVTVNCNNKQIYQTEIMRKPADLISPVDYVNQFAGSSGSRWMIGPGPWMPFGMTKIMPDNEDQRWKAGYEYQVENIAGFSQVHEWTMTSMLMMPITGKVQLNPGPENEPDMGYRSRIDKKMEVARIGYYAVDLTDHNIKAELTATSRATMQRYTFPESESSCILIDLFIPGEYSSTLKEARVKKVSDTEIEGSARLVMKHTDYHGVQDYTMNFVIQFSKPFESMDGWIQDMMFRNIDSLTKNIRPWGTFYPMEHVQNEMGDAGLLMNFKTRKDEQVSVRTGVSLVSIENARLNLTSEINTPFGWNFEKIVQQQRDVWNELFSRVQIESDDYLQKEKFYTNLYRAISPRTTWNDVNGEWMDMDERVRKMKDTTKSMYGSDAYWGLHWNLNQFYNFLYPEFMSGWMNTFQEMYIAGGWLPIGNPGLEYYRVMVGAPSVPMIVSAYQHGIRDFDVKKLSEAIYHQQTANPQEYPGGGRVGNESYPDYIKLGYVPLYKDLHHFDSLHYQSYVSNTMEYSYQDYCTAQFFKALGENDKYSQFIKRSENWRNTFDNTLGFTRPRNPDGTWYSQFDPHRAPGYCEGSAWQFTWYVPQNVKGLIGAMGEKRFIERLNEGFEISEKAYFSSEFGYSPINHGNQTSMQSAYLFNYTKQPWLTQKWVRGIQEKYYGTGTRSAYPGDEDQGQMSSWYVMSTLGLFQMNGGCDTDPVFELGSPRFEKAVISLSSKYYSGNQLVIEAKNASGTNCYIQSASLNGKQLTSPFIPWSMLKNGGKLQLVMGDKQNKQVFK